MSHELPAKFRPKFAASSHTCCANVARHSRNKIANFLHFATVARVSRDIRATFARHVMRTPGEFWPKFRQGVRATFVQHSCDIRANVVQFFFRNLVTKCLNYVAICSQFILNSFAILSRSARGPRAVRACLAPVNVRFSFLSSIRHKFSCNRSPTPFTNCLTFLALSDSRKLKLRRVRDGFETPATTL